MEKEFDRHQMDCQPPEEKIKIRLARAERGPSGVIEKFVNQYENEFQTGEDILEVGSGEGRNFEAFKNRPDLKLHGIEYDSDAVKISQEHLNKIGIKADIIQGSFTDLPFKPESMRAVISHSSIQNARTWPDLEKTFSEITRVLKPGGLFLMRDNYAPRLIDADRKNRVAYFTEEEIEKLTKQNGFDIIAGEKPVEGESDASRVGGKKIAWELILRKNEVRENQT